MKRFIIILSLLFLPSCYVGSESIQCRFKDAEVINIKIVIKKGFPEYELLLQTEDGVRYFVAVYDLKHKIKKGDWFVIITQ